MLYAEDVLLQSWNKAGERYNSGRVWGVKSGGGGVNKCRTLLLPRMNRGRDSRVKLHFINMGGRKQSGVRPGGGSALTEK